MTLVICLSSDWLFDVHKGLDKYYKSGHNQGSQSKKINHDLIHP